MSQESKKVRAPDPHLRCPQVGHGEAADGRSLQNGEVSASVQKESKGPYPTAPHAKEQIENPGQSFPCKFAGKGQKEGFFGQ